MTTTLAIAATLALAYALFAAYRIGLLHRLPLALGRMSLEAIPDRAARRHGERTLFTTDLPCDWEVPALRARYPDPARWSAVRIRSTAGFVAGMLRARFGLAHGERVAILKENHLDALVLTIGIVRAGGIACPLNGRFASEKLRAYLANVGARILITDRPTLLRIVADRADLGPVASIVLAGRRGDSGFERLEEELAATHPGLALVWIEEALAEVGAERPAVPRGKDEPLVLVHSSGTTGFPKAVILKNGAQSHAVRGWLCYVHVSPRRDRGYLAVPTNHQAVILTFHALLLLGVPVHWTGACGRERFDAKRVLREIAQGGFTGFFGFPIAYTQMAAEALDPRGLSRMRFWATTADASHAAIVRRFVRVGGLFRALGLPFAGSVFLDAQGSSEVGTPSVLRYVTRFTRAFDRRVGRPGSTPFGPRVRIVRCDGSRAPRGEVGRLEVRGRTVTEGYWNHHAMTLRAMRDGWFFTGDVARLGRDGHVVQLDREVDVIHTADGPTYSLPIEEVVHEHAAVFDACVYGARQPDGTQLPAAWIALRAGVAVDPGTLLEELNARLPLRSRLARLEIRPWSEFPIGITGKTLKRALREATEPVAPPEENRPLTAA